MTEYVKKITPEKKEAILQNSVMSMPNAAVGNPSELKKAFVNPIINADGNACLADEIDRIAQETNEALEKQVSKDGDTMTGSLTLVAKDGSIKLSAESGAVEVTGPTDFYDTIAAVKEECTTVSYGAESIKIKTVLAGDFGTEERDEIEIKFPTKSGILATKADVAGIGKIPSIITLFVDPQSYELKATLATNVGEIISSATIDLPLEEMVVDGRFDDATNSVVLTLKNGTEVEFSVVQLVNGLVSSADFQAFVSQKGQANGFASLDENGKVPKEQLPSDIGGGGISNNIANESTPGVISGDGKEYAYGVFPNGQLHALVVGKAEYQNLSGDAFVSKGTLELNKSDLIKSAGAALKEDVNGIYKILDLVGVTETVETTSTYDARNTAEIGDDNLYLLPNVGTEILEVTGNSYTTRNFFDALQLKEENFDINIVNISIEQNGYIIKFPMQSFQGTHWCHIGKFSELVPLAKVGDKFYIYADNAEVTGSALASKEIYFDDLIDNTLLTYTINSGEPFEVNADILNSKIGMYIRTFSTNNNGSKIEGLRFVKEKDELWSRYISGLDSAKFNGVVSSGKNLWDNSKHSWTVQGDYIKTSPIELTGCTDVTISVNGQRVRDVFPSNRAASVALYDKDMNELVFGGEKFLNYQTIPRSIFYTYPNAKYFVISAYIKDVEIPSELNTQIEVGGEITQYEPHIAPSIFNFPATEMPLGRVLDFENKKVKDYGVEIALNGNEAISRYSYAASTGNCISINNVLPESEPDYLDFAISTDATVGWGYGKFRIGSGQKIQWLGISDLLGFTQKDTAANEEEMAASIVKVKEWLANRFASGNPVTFRYISSHLQSERDMTEEEIAAGNTYMPIAGGIEYQNENSSAIYGANNTITQEYEMYRKLGGDN